jgi:hypothetical protein
MAWILAHQSHQNQLFQYSLGYNDLEGGVKIGNKRIKALMYADDIVLLSDHPIGLREMLTSLEKFCETWALKVNVEKSKVMVFENRKSKNTPGCWYYKNSKLETVSEFKYLGIVVNQKFSFDSHLDRVGVTAKFALNSVWNKVFLNSNFNLETMIRIFNAIIRAIMCYGCEVWGFKLHDSVEKVQKYFIKKVLNLPSFTPDYMIFLELGFKRLYLFTLKLHFSYIVRSLSSPANKMTKQLIYDCINYEVEWVKEWKKIFRVTGISVDLSCFEEKAWKAAFSKILLAVDDGLHLDDLLQAQCSTTCPGYIERVGFGDFDELKSMPCAKASVLLKARCELLNLNGRRFSASSSRLCSLCNMGKIEDSYHFIVECPTLIDIRKQFLECSSLSRKEFVELLGQNNMFDCLGDLIIALLKYRVPLIREFNF